jgi:DNA processing protein
VSRTVRPGDAEWPPQLSEIETLGPPHELFVTGARLEPEATAVAVVGTRRPTGAGLEAARAIARGFAEAGWVVVSGLAVGIDAAAHRAALDAGGRTIAVLGCGLDVRYPASNACLRAQIARRGTLVSEYPPGTPPRKHHFPLRNRIIAGLVVGVVVVEGALTSGALVTARLALDADRNVYAVPGSIWNPMARGPNELIRTARAALVTEAGHVFEDLAPRLAWAPTTADDLVAPPTVSEHEAALLNALDDVPLSIDVLVDATALRPGCVAAALAQLEVRALVTRSHGGYSLSRAGARSRVARRAVTTSD